MDNRSRFGEVVACLIGAATATVIGCSSNPIERATQIEKDRAEVLSDDGDCDAVKAAWKAYQDSVYEEAALEKMFKYIQDNLTNVESSTNKEIDEQFCDFLIAHGDVAGAFTEQVDTKKCVVELWQGTGYNLRSFEREVYAVNNKLQRWDPKRALGGVSAGYWRGECKQLAIDHYEKRKKK